MSRREGRADRMVEYPAPAPPPSKCAKVLYYTWKLCSVVFSHCVMISLVVAYCIFGAVTFEKLEADYEREVKANISHIRANTTDSILAMTRATAVLNCTNWTADVTDMLKDFESAILLEMKVRGWDGNESTDHIQWTFTGALFYSIIVITTIALVRVVSSNGEKHEARMLLDNGSTANFLTESLCDRLRLSRRGSGSTVTGYGHITPKTQTGKVVTIFYAILGIPLMLLCLSNIGDVMASSFRFLYWRVCCYVCTRPPKRRHRHRHHSVRRSVRGGSGRGSSRRRRPPPAPLQRAHSDTDCRYRDSGYDSSKRRVRAAAAAARPRSQPPSYRNRPYHGARNIEDVDRSPVRFDTRHSAYADVDRVFPKISLPLNDLEAALKDLDTHMSKVEGRSKSLPRPAKTISESGPRRDFEDAYYEDEDDPDLFEMHDLHDVDFENFKERKALDESRKRETDDFYYRDRGYDPEDEDYDLDSPRTRRARPDRRYDRGRSEYMERDVECERRGRRARSAAAAGGERRAGGRRLRRLHTLDDTARGGPYTPSPEIEDYSDEPVPLARRNRPPVWDPRQLDIYPDTPDTFTKEEIKPVPIWLCVCLVASYIVAGTFLFKQWENWAYLDAAYFCFITLTTIGFGDFVPAQGQSGATSDAVHSIALCSLYLLFGIALLAMSFNLVQEEVRANVASLATKLGIIKPRDDDTDDEY